MAVYEIRNAHGAVVNLVEWDGVSPFDPGEGLTLHECVAPEPSPEELAIVAATIEIDKRRAALIADIQAKCAKLIEGGIMSSALGAPHLYPSKFVDQFNLKVNRDNAVESGQPTLHMCADQAGIWAFRMHTPEQIVQVGNDFTAAIFAIRLANAAKQAEVMAPDFTLEDAEAYDVDAGWPA